MMFTFEHAGKHETKRLGFISTKFALLIFIYIGASQVVCDQEISFCDTNFKELKNDVEVWNKKCWNNGDQGEGTPYCKAEKEYNQERMKMHVEMCFSSGPYPEPYLFLRSSTEILAIDLLTLDTTVVISGLTGMAIDIDTVDKKLYFRDGNKISRANYDGSSVEVIVQNVDPRRVRVDWKGRRIFWITNRKNYISMATLNGQERRVLRTTEAQLYDLAVDSNLGYLFWQERGGFLRGISLATHKMLTLEMRVKDDSIIKLDCVNKKVYSLDKYWDFIFAIDYDDGNEGMIINGQFYILSVFNNSLYFMNYDRSYIKEINNGNASRSILVHRNYYYDLIVVHNSLQPLDLKGSLIVTCGGFAYCNNGLCQCEPGFEWNVGECTDIDECSSSPCGPNTKYNCTNLMGSYKCNTCAQGYILDKATKKCGGPYREPYLFIRSETEILAINLLTLDTTVVIRGLTGLAMDIDTVDKKLYFHKGNDISRANFDGSSVEVIVQNVEPRRVRVDWKGRRIFWTTTAFGNNDISMATLNGQERRVLRTTENRPYDLAVDTDSGYLFWQECGGFLRRISLATHKMLTLEMRVRVGSIIKLDCINKQVYGFEEYGRYIFASDYDGGNQRKIISGQFWDGILSVFNGSLYFMNYHGSYIKEINNGNASRSIVVQRNDYYDLIVVHNSLQPLDLKGCPDVTCGRFAYCNNGSCQCEPGFEWNVGECTDIDECSSSPCGPNTKYNCTNLMGSYKCNTCAQGYILDKATKKCGEAKIRLVNSTTSKNNTGRIRVYHPNFGWGTVCDWWWRETESNVACRQLGFIGANETRKEAYFGRGSGPILLDYVRCTGKESYIWDCRYRGWNVEFCGYHEDVGVECY